MPLPENSNIIGSLTPRQANGECKPSRPIPMPKPPPNELCATSRADHRPPRSLPASPAMLFPPLNSWTATSNPKGSASASIPPWRTIAGGYLRTFAFQHGLSWGRRLIARYTRNGMATNERFLRPISPVTCRSEQNGSVWRVRNQKAAVGRREQEIV
jgi:hypothetical protein